jgi:hypothetical protein
MVVRWLSQLDPAERPAGRSWICATLGLPTAIAQLFDAGSLHQDDAEVLRDHLSWIALFARAGSSEERHDLVVGLIQARSAEGDGHFADRITAELFPTASEELHDLIVHLLSGVGPLPPFANTSPELLSRLVPLMPALPLVGALFCSPEGALTRSPVLIEAVVARVKEAAVAYPAWGYTVAQIRRHAGLARRLSELAGWERMTPDPEVLKRIGPRELRLLGLAFELDLNLDLDLDRERRETAQTWRGGVARLVPGGDVEALLATPGHPAIEQAHRKCLDLAKRLEREDALPGPPLTAPPNPTLEAFRQWWQQLEALFATLGRLQEDLADLEKKIRWAREELVPRARLYFQQYAALPVDRRPPELEALNEAVRALVESDGVSTRQTYTRFREAFEQVERFHEQR